MIYTDGSKTGLGAFVVNGQVYLRWYTEASPQVVECLVVLEVLQHFSEPINIVSDSSYVVKAVNLLEAAGIIKASSRVASIFAQIQNCLLARRSPFILLTLELILDCQDLWLKAMIWQTGLQK